MLCTDTRFFLVSILPTIVSVKGLMVVPGTCVVFLLSSPYMALVFVGVAFGMRLEI